MEILPIRDLVQDDFGNYYTATKVNGNKLTLVNAIVHNSFKPILDKDFIEDAKKQYDGKSVAVGQYFTDMLKRRIEGLSNGKYPGGIYKLSDVVEEYEIEFDFLYEMEVSISK